jgi:Na+/proline symporter
MNIELLWPLLLYVAVMIGVGVLGYKRNIDLEELNVANRKVNWVQTGFSIAATWIWAPALFVASQRAYVDGVLGFFWFFVPNVLSLILFGFISSKALKRMTFEQTLPDLMGNVYQSKRVKDIYNIQVVFLLMMSTGVQLLAGGIVLNQITGIDFGILTLLLALVALIYSLVSGIRASIRTDAVQMIIIIVALAFALIYFGPTESIQLGGINSRPIGFFTDYNWQLFLAFGLTTSIGLIAGPIADQTFWQRAFSMECKTVKKSFMLGAFIFALVPFGMAIIGFMASASGFVPNNVSIVGLEFVLEYAPTLVSILFILAIVSGLSSTLDSNMVAMGSVLSNLNDRTRTVYFSRLGMVIIALFGIAVANIPNIDIFWLFLFYGVMRSSVAVPTVFTMISKKIPNEQSIFFGILGAFLFGVTTYAIGAVAGIRTLALTGTLLTIIIPTLTITFQNKLKELV